VPYRLSVMGRWRVTNNSDRDVTLTKVRLSKGHRNCGGHIHAVFICNATLFCAGKGQLKE